jgi:uncharacterized protein
MTELEQQVVDSVERTVRARMSGQQAGHGVDHVLRVLKTASAIQAELGGDRFVVQLAAWLHDIGDAKFHEGVERSAEFAREILVALDVSSDVVDHVAHIVDNISFRKGSSASELTLEGKIVQDADRLDALGAIGIVRTIEYGAAFDQPFYLADNQSQRPTGVGHFHEKLFKLRELLNTEPARRLAGQREAFMRNFLEQFLRECGQVAPAGKLDD